MIAIELLQSETFLNRLYIQFKLHQFMDSNTAQISGICSDVTAQKRTVCVWYGDI